MKNAVLAAGIVLIVAACTASSGIKELCQAALDLASANTNLSDALTGMERSDEALVTQSLLLAQADLKKASELASRVPRETEGMLPGTVSGLADALTATSVLFAELPTHGRSDVPALRMRVDDAQLALIGNPGLPDQCTMPIRPPIE